MSGVTELGYIGLGVGDLAEWREFASGLLALEVVDGDSPEQCFARLDNWHHRIILQEDGTDDLAFLGLRVAGDDEFAEMYDLLKAAGVEVKIASVAEARDRHVLEFMKFTDPNGFALEIFHGPHVQTDKPFYPGRRMHGQFKTGSGGLGHTMLCNKTDLSEIRKFYRMLGLRGGVEYRVPVPELPAPVDLMFLHCNTRDHSIAFGATGPKRINHLMFECENFDDVGLTYEMVQASGYPVGIAPGKHANDQMFSFYFMNPSNWMIEVGWGGRPATHQSEFYQRDAFGHESQEGVVHENMEPITRPVE